MGPRQSKRPSADHISTDEINSDKRKESPLTQLGNGPALSLSPAIISVWGGSDVLLNTKGKIFRKIFDKVAATRSRCAGIMLGLRAGGGRRRLTARPPFRTEL
ncbi:hypothetical protein EVAR_103213_1 [Eumeta japonica]|uniref:Uncharacterized protein n=1 Tax=Eumeta variegata TaxID=151549 RepID=A0A4C2A0I3_EUMVA|nr:hypothetical protein EVAR_103213_1 [Eumeta japonica]